MLKSLKPFGLDKKILIVCMDRKGYTVLQNMGYSAVCLETNMSAFCPWNSNGYDKICYVKLEIIHTILSLNNNVLLVDGDIVFQKDPMPDIVTCMRDAVYDVWIQNDTMLNTDTTNLCTGYIFIRSNPLMCQLYDCVSVEVQAKYERCAFDNNDQSFFNVYVKPYCKMSPLPLETYPNGQMFYNNPTLKESAVLVHFNWIRGHLKMAKMKEYKMWLLDDDEEDF